MALGLNIKTGEMEYILTEEDKAALIEAIEAPQPEAASVVEEKVADEEALP
jgi:hypothetical protein